MHLLRAETCDDSCRHIYSTYADICAAGSRVSQSLFSPLQTHSSAMVTNVPFYPTGYRAATGIWAWGSLDTGSLLPALPSSDQTQSPHGDTEAPDLDSEQAQTQVCFTLCKSWPSAYRVLLWNPIPQADWEPTSLGGGRTRHQWQYSVSY